MRAISLIIVMALAIFAFDQAKANQNTDIQSLLAAWDSTANQAKIALENGNSSTSNLEQLRLKMAAERDAAKQLAETTNPNIRALQAQLAVLGPAPDDKQLEPQDVAQRRLELEQQIASQSAPLIAAQERVERANVLIAELDNQIREQKTADLLTRYPSVLSFDIWPSVLNEIGHWIVEVHQEALLAISVSLDREQSAKQIPLSTMMVLLAFLILFVITPQAVKRSEFRRRQGDDGTRQIGPAVSCALARLVFPSLAVIILLFAIDLLNLTMGRLTYLADSGPQIAIDLVLCYWLAHLIFSPTLARHRLFKFDDKASVQGARLIIAIGVVSALEIILTLLDTRGQLSPASLSFLSAPFMVASALLLWALASVLISDVKQKKSESAGMASEGSARTELHLGHQFRRYLSLAIKFGSLVIFAAAIGGYARLSRDVFDAIVQTLALMALALVLFYALLTLSGWVFNKVQKDEDEREPLFPILLATVLGLSLLPLLAMVWGASPSEVYEVWGRLSDGISIGEVTISAGGIITLAAVFSIVVFFTRWVQMALRSTVLPRTRMDIGARNAVVTGVGYVGYTLALLLGLSSAGLDLSNLAIVAGALSVGIGFGLQAIVSNFVSGIILLIERPVKEGDWIEVSGNSGYVRKISVRSTRIETFDMHEVIIPNADLISGSVKNMTLSNMRGRVIVPVGIAYGSDVEKAKEIMMEVAAAHPIVLKHPAPTVLFMEMADSALLFELRAFLKDVNWVLGVRSDLMTSIYTKFRDANIQIPFPQRDVHLHLSNQTEATTALGKIAGKAAD